MHFTGKNTLTGGKTSQIKSTSKDENFFLRMGMGYQSKP